VGISQTVDQRPALEALRQHLGELQLPQIVHGRRAIILFEGPEGAGKKNALKQLAAAFDPCHYAVHWTRYERREAAEGHWLAPFWRQLPSAGNTAIFFRSWYRRVLDERIGGRTDEASVNRVFDEINEFEAQQRDYGTLILKLYFDVSPEVQSKRLEDAARNPWRRARRSGEPVRVDDKAYVRAFADLKANSDTRWSPWRIIDADDEQSAGLATLEAVADVWSAAMPSEPPHLVEAPVRVA